MSIFTLKKNGKEINKRLFVARMALSLDSAGHQP